MSCKLQLTTHGNSRQVTTAANNSRLQPTVAEHSRLRRASDAEADEAPKDQHPDEVGRRCAEQPEVEGEHRAQDQLLRAKTPAFSDTLNQTSIESAHQFMFCSFIDIYCFPFRDL